MKGIQVCSNEGPHPFPRGYIYVIVKIHWRNLKIFFSRTTGPISTKLSTKHPWMMGIQVCSNVRLYPFPRGDHYKLTKIHWGKLKVFFSRTTGPISTKLGTMQSLVNGIQICLNEEPRPFPRGDNYKIAKIYWQKIFSRTTGLISFKLSTKHPWMMGIQVYSNEGPHPFPREDN
mgnify:CR=1 FL=1